MRTRSWERGRKGHILEIFIFSLFRYLFSLFQKYPRNKNLILNINTKYVTAVSFNPFFIWAFKTEPKKWPMQGQRVTCNMKGAWLGKDANNPSQSGREKFLFHDYGDFIGCASSPVCLFDSLVVIIELFLFNSVCYVCVCLYSFYFTFLTLCVIYMFVCINFTLLFKLCMLCMYLFVIISLCICLMCM